MARRRQRYSAVAMLLHWLIAGLIVFNIALGWRMDGPRGPEAFAVFQLHKSIGITVLLLTVLRILWRLTHRAPDFPTSVQPWEQMLARAVHFLFYAFLLGMPLTGWLIVSASKTNIPTLLFQTIPWPHVPGVATLGAGAKAGVEDCCRGRPPYLRLPRLCADPAPCARRAEAISSWIAATRSRACCPPRAAC